MATKLFVCLLASISLFVFPNVVTAESVYNCIAKEVDEYELPMVDFELDALEPHVDAKTMNVHIFGHHNGYKTKTNAGLSAWREEEPDNEFARQSILKIVQNLDKVPEKYRTHMRNYGGGFVNHCFYFGTLSPNDDSEERFPTGDLLEDINAEFGSVDKLKKLILDEAKALFGSGYVWLSRTPGAPRPNLRLHTTVNQDSPVSDGLHPILVVDVWEHAYYLKHNYRRWDHLKDFWMVLDWESVAKLDKWWANQEEEEKKAAAKVQELKDSIAERLKAKEEKNIKKEKNGEKKKSEL